MSIWGLQSAKWRRQTQRLAISGVLQRPSLISKVSVAFSKNTHVRSHAVCKDTFKSLVCIASVSAIRREEHSINYVGHAIRAEDVRLDDCSHALAATHSDGACS